MQIEFCGPKIVDAYIRYRPFEQLNFQLGEYKLPFSIENTDYVPLKYEFIGTRPWKTARSKLVSPVLAKHH